MRLSGVGTLGVLWASAALCGLLGPGVSSARALEAASRPITVETDRALVLRLDRPAGTIVIGNPMIADAAVQNGTTLVLTGKSYGVTNMIILGPDGEEVSERLIEVQAATSGLVTVHRGVARSTYSCTPVCQRTLVLGDTPETFDQVNGQITTRNGLAQGAAGGGN